jgi:hypothetical protein
MTTELVLPNPVVAADRSVKSGQPSTYRGLIPVRCSADCGASIVAGQPCVQTSPDLNPLERAHLACWLRKGIDSLRLEDGTLVEVGNPS